MEIFFEMKRCYRFLAVIDFLQKVRFSKTEEKLILP